MKKLLQFFATFLLCAAFSLSVTAQENLVRNGDFMGQRVDPGWVSIHEITNTTGAEFWHVQFNQGLSQDQIDAIEVGETYELTFYAKAEIDKQVAVFFGEDGGSFHNLLDPDGEGVSIIDLTTEEQSFSFDFVGEQFDVMKLGFEGGLSNVGYSISNVEIMLDDEDPTYIHENYLSNIRVYPNPAFDRINVEANEGATINVINIMGSVVDSKIAESDAISFDVSSLPSGVYIISIEDRGERATHKVIVR